MDLESINSLEIQASECRNNLINIYSQVNDILSKKDNKNQLQRQKIHIEGTDNLYLNAVKLEGNISDIRIKKIVSRTPGILFWVEKWNHFVMNINGHMFNGNIGKYLFGPNKSKIKDCRRARCTRKPEYREDCTFYHNPADYRFQGSKDVRNYFGNEYCYVATSDKQEIIDSNHMKIGNHFGSLEHLETNIEDMDNENQKVFFDHMFHNLLCSLVLQENTPG